MNSQSEAQRIVNGWADRLRTSGLQGPEVLSSTYDAAHFGNAEAIFRIGSLLIRIVRDRGQELLSVAASQTPEQFYPVEDVDIAMGWKTIDEVIARDEPEQLDLVATRLAQHFDQLAAGLTGERERFTRARIEKATKGRREAFMNRLRSKK